MGILRLEDKRERSQWGWEGCVGRDLPGLGEEGRIRDEHKYCAGHSARREKTRQTEEKEMGGQHPGMDGHDTECRHEEG